MFCFNKGNTSLKGGSTDSSKSKVLSKADGLKKKKDSIKGTPTKQGSTVAKTMTNSPAAKIPSKQKMLRQVDDKPLIKLSWSVSI